MDAVAGLRRGQPRHNNQNAEIYYPPYLFRSVNGVAQLAPRPVMTTFGDPAPGLAKTCRHVAMTRCASENGRCSVPAGSTAVVYCGAAGSFHARRGASGSVACNNAVFGDPLPGTVKACWR